MEEEKRYRFIDKSGDCFSSFQDMDEGDGYRDHVGRMLRASDAGEYDFCIGDIVVFIDELKDAGFKWETDFFVKKKEKSCH